MEAEKKADRIGRFYQYRDLYACPVCGKKIRYHAGGLVCKKEHRFDISSRGYVNMLGAAKTLKGYDKQFFRNRSAFFAKGYYSHILDAVTDAVLEIAGDIPEGPVIVDAGCGEGYYSASLARRIGDARIIAFDVAADAIACAAGSPENVAWTIADVTRIPVMDRVCDILLDIFTPANYGEFGRIMKKDGYILKVVPGAGHLKELRAAARDLLKNKDYSNEDVSGYFEKHCRVMKSETLTRTSPVDREALELLTGMTPLLFDADVSRLDLSGVGEITVEGRLIIGRV